jgi:hypothetical protein
MLREHKEGGMVEPLDDSGWRAFRLFMLSLPDEDFKNIANQLRLERRHRETCESSVTRLFFSSLSADDLKRADAEICGERAARLNELRLLRSLSVLPKAAGKNRRRAKSQSS